MSREIPLTGIIIIAVTIVCIYYISTVISPNIIPSSLRKVKIILDSSTFMYYEAQFGIVYKGVPFTITNGKRKGESYFYVVNTDGGFDHKKLINDISSIIRYDSRLSDRIFHMTKDDFKKIHNRNSYRNYIVDILPEAFHVGGRDGEGNWVEGQCIMCDGRYFIIDFETGEDGKIKTTFCTEVDKSTLNLEPLYKIMWS